MSIRVYLTRIVYIYGVVINSGELLLDQQRFQEAVEKFDRAIELEKAKYVQFTHFLLPC